MKERSIYRFIKILKQFTGKASSETAQKVKIKRWATGGNYVHVHKWDMVALFGFELKIVMYLILISGQYLRYCPWCISLGMVNILICCIVSNYINIYLIVDVP